MTLLILKPGGSHKYANPCAQVWDPEKVIIIPDHYIFTSDPRANRNVDILRSVCRALPCA